MVSGYFKIKKIKLWQRISQEKAPFEKHRHLPQYYRAYMDLAFKTNGSIHTMEQSLNELYKLKEGEEFDFMGKMYVVKKDGIKTLDSVEKSISI